MKVKNPFQPGNQSFSKIKKGKVEKKKQFSIEYVDVKQDENSVKSKKKPQQSFTSSPVKVQNTGNSGNMSSEKKKRRKKHKKNSVQNISVSESPQVQNKQHQNQQMKKTNNEIPVRKMGKQQVTLNKISENNASKNKKQSPFIGQNKPAKPESDDDDDEEDTEEESEEENESENAEQDSAEENESEEDSVKPSTKTFVPAVQKSNNLTESKDEEEEDDDSEEDDSDEGEVKKSNVNVGEAEEEDTDDDDDDDDDDEDEEGGGGGAKGVKGDEEESDDSDDDSDESEEGPVETKIGKGSTMAIQDIDRQSKKNKDVDDFDTPSAKKFKESLEPLSNDQSGPPYKVFLGNLPENVTDLMVREAFSFAGNIVTVEIQVKFQSLKPSGFGFMELEDEETMQKVIDLNNIVKIDEQPVSIRKAYASNEFSPHRGGGGRGGRGGGFGRGRDRDSGGFGGGRGGRGFRGGRGGDRGRGGGDRGFRGGGRGGGGDRDSWGSNKRNERGGGGFRGGRGGRGGGGGSPFRGGRGFHQGGRGGFGDVDVSSKHTILDE